MYIYIYIYIFIYTTCMYTYIYMCRQTFQLLFARATPHKTAPRRHRQTAHRPRPPRVFKALWKSFTDFGQDLTF